MSLFSTLRFLLRHPLTGRAPVRAVSQFLRWQVGSRVLGHPAVVPFVNDTRLLVRRGMTGATGNVYAGLHEYEEMSFLLHALRPSDTFFDIGANVGSYTVLASGAAGARTVAIEPVPSAFGDLVNNIRLNGLGDRVTLLNIGLSHEPGTLHFSTSRDTMNSVLVEGEGGEAAAVAVKPLDDLVGAGVPFAVKIDVEGYEYAVLQGAKQTLADPALQVIVIEMNGSGVKYGHPDRDVAGLLEAAGFQRVRYRPEARDVTPAGAVQDGQSNGIYVRDIETIRERLRGSREFTTVWGTV